MTTLDLPLALVLAFSWVAMPTYLAAWAVYGLLEGTEPPRAGVQHVAWSDQGCAMQNPCFGLTRLSGARP